MPGIIRRLKPESCTANPKHPIRKKKRRRDSVGVFLFLQIARIYRAIENNGAARSAKGHDCPIFSRFWQKTPKNPKKCKKISQARKKGLTNGIF